MRRSTLTALVLSVLFQLGLCSTHRAAKVPLPARTIHQFPNPTWIENLAVRPNGNLLLTDLSGHQLWELDPTKADSTVLVYTFPNSSAVSGITELADDSYIVAVGNFTNHKGVPGSWSFWRVDYNCEGTSPTIDKVLYVPGAVLPNGVITLTSDTVLVGDAGRNSSWTLNTTSLTYRLAMEVPEMTPPPGSKLDEGLNGLQIYRHHLYWTNSEADTLYRIGIDRRTGKAVRNARVEAVANVTTFIDDFAFDHEGRAWMATDAGNTLIVVPTDNNKNSTYWTVDGSATSTSMEGSTACAFGRGRDDRHILYVTTNGGLTAPINGTVVEGGKVVAVDTRGFEM